jgi:hypothetical protein
MKKRDIASIREDASKMGKLSQYLSEGKHLI